MIYFQWREHLTPVYGRGEEQTPSNVKLKARTAIRQNGRDTHSPALKKEIATVAVVVWSLTQGLPAKKGAKDNQFNWNWTIFRKKFDRSDEFAIQI